MSSFTISLSDVSSSLLPYYRRLRDLEPELFELPPLLLLPYLDELPLPVFESEEEHEARMKALEETVKEEG